MKTFTLLALITWAGLWLTPDQQGQRHFQRGEFAEAAKDFAIRCGRARLVSGCRI